METTKKELEEINKKHFKGRPNAVKFCKECDLKEKVYCETCAKRQTNKLKYFRKEE